MYRLSYVTPMGDVIDSGKINLNDRWVHAWLDAMVEEHPNTIFFLTTPTTDIF